MIRTRVRGVRSGVTKRRLFLAKSSCLIFILSFFTFYISNSFRPKEHWYLEVLLGVTFRLSLASEGLLGVPFGPGDHALGSVWSVIFRSWGRRLPAAATRW